MWRRRDRERLLLQQRGGCRTLPLDEAQYECELLLEVDVEVAAVRVNRGAAVLFCKCHLLLHGASGELEEADGALADLDEVAEARLLVQDHMKHTLRQVLPRQCHGKGGVRQRQETSSEVGCGRGAAALAAGEDEESE